MGPPLNHAARTNPNVVCYPNATFARHEALFDYLCIAISKLMIDGGDGAIRGN